MRFSDYNNTDSVPNSNWCFVSSPRNRSMETMNKPMIVSIHNIYVKWTLGYEN